MLTTAKSWALATYTDNTWTNVVAEVATLAAVLLANTTASTALIVELRVEASGSTVAQILPPVLLDAGAAQVLDVRSLNIVTGQALQVRASAAGIHVLVSGAI